MTYKPTISRSIVLVAFTAIALAATGYLRGNPAAPPDTLTYHTYLAAPGDLPEDDWTGGPRECDVMRGITTSCIFPD